MSSKRRMLYAKNRCTGVMMWLSHIEVPYNSQLGSAQRNKQPDGKQTYFLLLHFICFKIVKATNFGILTMPQLEKYKFWSPQFSMWTFSLNFRMTSVSKFRTGFLSTQQILLMLHKWLNLKCRQNGKLNK